jgi:hypothetical protein
MRFKKIETEKGELAQGQTDKATTQLGERKEHPCRDKERGTLPLEWRELERFVEAHRAVRPSESYLTRFWHRFLPRLRVAIRKDELVREYLRETFWQRWIVRTAAAAAIALCAFGWIVARQENLRLQSHLTQLERDFQTLKAGM